MICRHFLFLKILMNWNMNKNFNSHCKYQLRMKGKEIKETRSWIKEHIKELHLSATFCAWLFRSCLNEGGEQQTGREP